MCKYRTAVKMNQYSPEQELSVKIRHVDGVHVNDIELCKTK